VVKSHVSFFCLSSSCGADTGTHPLQAGNLDPELADVENARRGTTSGEISFFVSGSMDILPSRTANPVHSKLLVGIIGILALLATIGFLMIAFSKGKTKPQTVANADDPRSTFPTPYRNVRPEVKYVGDQACAACHPVQSASFHQSPMGRSLVPISDIVAQERYDPKTNNPFEKLGFFFQVDRREGRVYHRQARKDAHGHVITEHEEEVQFVLGSGNHGRSYLFNRGGHLYLSAISWFSEKQIWDLSPGFADLTLSGRPIRADCLVCHCNQAHAVKDTENRYGTPIFEGYSIGCERCHGPGELHVKSRQNGEAIDDRDDTIVNPSRLTSSLREAICEQCHLLGQYRVLRRGRQVFDFRPGLPLHLVRSVFVAAPGVDDKDSDVSQVDQMYLSQCYRSSRGELGCISCHDPHDRPSSEKKEAYYRNRCLQCHKETGCGLPRPVRLQKSKEDSCTSCHMPRAPLAEIAHTASTDHRILRNPLAPPPESSLLPDPRKTLLVNFYQQLLEASDLDADRDLGIALSKYPGKTREVAQIAAQQALRHLEPAVQRHAEDVAAQEAKAWALWLLDRPDEALVTIETSLKTAPNRESTLQYAATFAEGLKRQQAAIDYWRRLVEINPGWPSYRSHLANLLADREDWPAAIKECQALLRIEPANVDIRFLLVQGYLQTSKPARARAELETVLKLRPDKGETLRHWFDAQFR
jgi:hypothetical protein